MMRNTLSITLVAALLGLVAPACGGGNESTDRGHGGDPTAISNPPSKAKPRPAPPAEGTDPASLPPAEAPSEDGDWR